MKQSKAVHNWKRVADGWKCMRCEVVIPHSKVSPEDAEQLKQYTKCVKVKWFK